MVYFVLYQRIKHSDVYTDSELWDIFIQNLCKHLVLAYMLGTSREIRVALEAEIGIPVVLRDRLNLFPRR